MKDLNLLVWLTQLGFSVAFPLGGFVWLGVWLHRRFDWGIWVILVAAGIGLLLALDGLRSSLKALSRLSKRQEDQPSSVSFNDHD